MVPCKNIEAILQMRENDIHYFWHQEDKITLTSKNYIWAYPGSQPIENSIAVLPELNNDNSITMLPKKLFGICSDFIKEYRGEE